MTNPDHSELMERAELKERIEYLFKTLGGAYSPGRDELLEVTKELTIKARDLLAALEVSEQERKRLRDALQPFVDYYEREGSIYGFRDADLDFLSRVIQFGWTVALSPSTPEENDDIRI